MGLLSEPYIRSVTFPNVPAKPVKVMLNAAGERVTYSAEAKAWTQTDLPLTD